MLFACRHVSFCISDCAWLISDGSCSAMSSTSFCSSLHPVRLSYASGFSVIRIAELGNGSTYRDTSAS